MSTLTTRNQYVKTVGGDRRITTIETDLPNNFDAIDARTAKCNFTGVAAPTGNDDSTEYYSPGSLWLYNHVYYICDSAAIGGALWRQFWPIPSTQTYFAATSRILARKTAGAGNGEECTISDVLDFAGSPSRGNLLARGASTWALLAVPSRGALLAFGANDPAWLAFVARGGILTEGAADPQWLALGSQGSILYTNATDPAWLGPGTINNCLVSGGSGANPAWTGPIWYPMPGTPVRVNDTSFTVTDTGNANLYNKMFSPGTIISWQKSGGGWQCAKITAASYGSPNVTFTIIGNTLAASFTAMKYCIHMIERDVFIIPGTMPGNTATADIGKTIYNLQDWLIISAQVRYKTGPTTTGATWDILDDGASIFTTKPPIAAGATLGTETVCDCVLTTADTVVAAGSLITLSYLSGHATTPGADAYVEIFRIPEAWRYMT